MKNLIAAAAFAVCATGVFAGEGTHYVAFHVDDGDPQLMNMALNNAQNVAAYYKEKGEEVVIEMVAYGPGLTMLIEGKSPVGDRVSTMALELDNISFRACGNTHRKMVEKAGKDVPLMSEATVVPSGVVHLVELQEQGYAYVRP